MKNHPPPHAPTPPKFQVSKMGPGGKSAGDGELQSLPKGYTAGRRVSDASIVMCPNFQSRQEEASRPVLPRWTESAHTAHMHTAQATCPHSHPEASHFAKEEFKNLVHFSRYGQESHFCMLWAQELQIVSSDAMLMSDWPSASRPRRPMC